MCFVGKFLEDDIRNGKKDEAVEKAMNETGLKYIHSEPIKDHGRTVGLAVWLSEYYF